ncbi:MAG: rhodanese-like domain-containing protein [Bacteroidetes bacterium]|nr:rhodanese-like domain-containing protein [Bacteroidota bacterium]MDA1267915.1 rhodanese-like domain-containing protein [Bacteroidota bacterium]
MKSTLFSTLILFFTSIACQSPSSSEVSKAATASSSTTAGGSVVTLTVQDFAAKSSKGTLLDVRTAGEVAQGKIEGALVIDFYSPNFLDQVSQISKGQELYLYCAVGARSEEAARMLLQQGYTKVYHLQGGIQAWSQEGMAMAK